MKKAMMISLAAAMMALGACAHEDQHAGSAKKSGHATAAAPRSDAQLALDDAEKALQAASDEFARSGNSAETQRLTDIAMAKVKDVGQNAPNEVCRERAAVLAARFDTLTQEQAKLAQAELDAAAKAKAQAEATPAPAPAPAEKPAAVAKVTPPEGAVVISNFGVGEAKLSQAMKEELDAAVKQLQGGDSTVMIEGHTDSTGPEKLNDKLSLTRAAAARDYLLSQGIDTSRIEIKGASATKPIESNNTAEERAKNRRIEVVITALKPVS